MLSVHTSPLAALGGRDTGGMNVYIRQLARELAGRGTKVDVYTRLSEPSTPFIQEDVPGFRVLSIPAGPTHPVSRDELHALLPEVVASINNQAFNKSANYDVLHSHYWLSGIAAERLAKQWRVPWAHMSHTLALLKDQHRGPHQGPESKLRRDSEDALLRAADGVVASNEIERRELVDRYGLAPSRIHVAPCGVDLHLFHPGNREVARQRTGRSSDERILLYVGRIEPLKGLDTLLAAAALLRDRVPGLKLLITGGSWTPDQPTEQELARLQGIARALNLEEVVEFLGPKSQTELPELYRAADVCAVPSRYESFGMAALESLACGTPVVASRTGGLQSTIRDGRNGYLVTIGDEREFADRLASVMCQPRLARRLGEEAARTATRYSWQRVADANLGAYHNLLAPNRTRVPLEVGADLGM
jgi:D-inositol-3-phosphate glycosyltransferase